MKRSWQKVCSQPAKCCAFGTTSFCSFLSPPPPLFPQPALPVDPVDLRDLDPLDITQPKMVSLAEAETRWQDRQCQAKRQAAKSLKLQRDKRWDEFYTRQHSSQVGRRMHSKLVLNNMLYITIYSTLSSSVSIYHVI